MGWFDFLLKKENIREVCKAVIHIEHSQRTHKPECFEFVFYERDNGERFYDISTSKDALKLKAWEHLKFHIYATGWSLKALTDDQLIAAIKELEQKETG